MTSKELKRIRPLKGLILQLETQLRQEEITDSVRGSYPAEPYILHNVKLRGYSDRGQELLAQLERYRSEYDRLIAYIDGIQDDQTKLMFHLRFIEGKSCLSIAYKIGGVITADAVRQRIYRQLRRDTELESIVHNSQNK